MNPNLAHDKNPRYEAKHDKNGRDDEEDNRHDQHLGPAVIHFAVAPGCCSQIDSRNQEEEQSDCLREVP